MSDPVVHLRRTEIEAKIKGLCELLEKQQAHEVTQHLRGQLTTWRAVLRWNDPLPVPKKPDETPVAIY